MNPQSLAQPISERSPSARSLITEPLRLDGRRLLVVEDDRELEPLVRRALSTINPPCIVDWCTTASQAYSYLSREYYDIVLADYVLEGSRAGITLRSTVWELQPQAVFAMTSSYPLTDYLQSVGRADCPFLSKPFGTRSLRQFVQNLLSPYEQGAQS